MENPYIIKVFHDFCEDASALVNQYRVYCSRVFDTQIAHRLLIETFSPDGAKSDYTHNNASLNQLLQKYLNRSNDFKDIIQTEMQNDKNFWDKRPLTDDMLTYASQDVIYLPYLYQSFCYVFENCAAKEKQSLSPRMLCEANDIFTEAMKCNDYANLNLNVKQLEAGTVIYAFVKNIQKFGIYCSLNLGITGLISHK